MKILRWTPSLPDMNIIEHAWDELDRSICVCDVLRQNTDQLWTALQEEWAKLDMAYINKLYDSMPHRVQALYDAEGAYTKY
jgi:adenine specific DNA methylase Mod